MLRDAPPLARSVFAAVLAALAGLLAAAPAAAGPATLSLRGPAAGALADAGVRLTARGPSASTDGRLRLLAGDLVREGGERYVGLTGELHARAGRRVVRLTGLELQLSGYAHLSARAGDRRLALLALDRGTGSWATSAEAATVRRARATLTRAGARLLRRQLRRPGIEHGPLGRLSVRASAPTAPAPVPALPTDAPAGARPIVAGTVRWAPRASWVSYLRQGEGASAAGDATFDGSAYTLPIAGGWYDPASASAAVRTAGTTRFRFTAHDIDLALGAWSYEISGGAGTASTLAEHVSHNASLVGQRVVTYGLDPTRLVPAAGADGATLTWSDVPLSLAESGTPLFNAYPPGSEQGSVTITATLGPATP